MTKKHIALLILLPLVVLFISLFLGRYWVSPVTTMQILLAQIFPVTPAWSPTEETIILSVRAPRALLALLVGASLSISGAAYQGMFRNPLVSPDILGVSSAAGFGAALGILLSTNYVTVQLLAFISGIIGVIITYSLSRIYKTTPVVMLVLAGVVVAALFSALISMTKYVADPNNKLPAITFWLMGSLSSTAMKDIAFSLPSMLIGGAGLLTMRWRINVLAMGDSEARSLGMRTEVYKGIIILCTTLVTASAVCVSGIVGWVGLVIPHITRMIVGPDHRVLLPATLSIGGTFLLLIDDIARNLTAAEIPLGILTAIVGAPFFGYLLRRTKGSWE